MTNADFEKLVDTSDEWIVSRTGIRERRIAQNGMPTSHMAVEAGKHALEMAGYTGEEIDLVIVGTVTPDYKLPSTACVMQEKMNLPNAVAFNMHPPVPGLSTGCLSLRNLSKQENTKTRW